MSEHVLTGVAVIVVLGILAQWIAWRLRLPSILLLLTAGFLAGPIFGLVHPDELLGDLLFPLVSLAVGLIMFEGALGLRFSQIAAVRPVIRNLISIGALTTWVLSAVAAHFILHFSWPLAVLLGAILVVTGPTVIIPLLRHVKPAGPVGPVLRWEGILIDPIGATLGLLVFEFILASGLREATAGAALNIIRTVAVGSVVGLGGAALVYFVIKRYWVPDYLQNPMTLMTVVGAFALSDHFQHESGLLAVTVMGVALANQRGVPIKHIIEFKENLGVLLLASLFVLLAARLELADLTLLGVETLVFVAMLILVVRPLSIALSSYRSSLTRNERLFLSWMAPRGIVAAAITSIFALRLTEAGFEGAERLVPVMFSVIVITVAVYGLTALPVARWLGIAPKSAPQGVMFVGAHAWARAIARELKARDLNVLMVDTNYSHVQEARMEGLETYYGSVLSEGAIDELSLEGIGRLLAMTSNDEVNALSALHFAEVFGKANVYQLPVRRKEALPDDEVPQHLRGRFLFEPDATYQYMEQLHDQGAEVKATSLTPRFDYGAYTDMYGENATPLFVIDDATGRLSVWTTGENRVPVAGQTLISFVVPQEETRVDLAGLQDALEGHVADL